MRTIKSSSNDSLAFQQHASGQFSAIKPCLGSTLTCEHTHPSIILQLYWDFCYVKFTGLLSSNLCNKASITFSRRMLLKLNCLSIWLSADCHIIFIAYTILLLQTQIKVIPIKFWVVYLKCVMPFSILSLHPTRGMMYYSIAKAGLDMATKQFALELAQHNIRVNSVNPTKTITETTPKELLEMEFLQNLKAFTPMRKFCSMEDVVRPIMYLLSEDSGMVTGSIHVVDGGVLTCVPTEKFS